LAKEKGQTTIGKRNIPLIQRVGFSPANNYEQVHVVINEIL